MCIRDSPQAEPARAALAGALVGDAVHVAARRPGREQAEADHPLLAGLEVGRPDLPLVAAGAETRVGQALAVGAEAGVNALRATTGDLDRVAAIDFHRVDLPSSGARRAEGNAAAVGAEGRE